MARNNPITNVDTMIRQGVIHPMKKFDPHNHIVRKIIVKHIEKVMESLAENLRTTMSSDYDLEDDYDFIDTDELEFEY